MKAYRFYADIAYLISCHWSLSSSCAEVFFQEDVLENFCKVHRETPVPESLFFGDLQLY